MIDSSANDQRRIPKAQSRLSDASGIPTREWYNYFRALLDAADGNPELEAQIQAILVRLEALENGSVNFQLLGLDSVIVVGTPSNGFVQINLDGDIGEPGTSWYYGSGPDGVKGWYAISDALSADFGELTKSVDPVTGVTSFGLESVPDGGVAPTLLKFTRDSFGRVDNTQAATASDVPIAKLGSSTWDNVQEAINVQNSPGLIDGGAFSDAGGGNLAYASMHIAIRPTDSDTATLYMADIAAGSIAIPNDSATRFVGVQYNAGAPNVIIKTADSWDYDTEFPLGEVANLGGTLFPLFNPYKVGDPITNVIQRFDAQSYAIRSAAGGLELSTDGVTRNLAMTAGVVWTRLNDHPIVARNSPTFPLIRVDPTGGTPPLSFTPGITSWPNTQYISGVTITTMGNNKWANLWIFVNIGTGAWGFAHGTAEYNNSSSAAAEGIPAYLTSNFLRQNIFVGRFIFEKNSNTAIVESAFTRVFSTQAVSNHNQLSGLQGGVLNEYYHLTSAEHSRIPPTGGTTGQFLRGDNSFTNSLTGPISLISLNDIANVSGVSISGFSSGSGTVGVSSIGRLQLTNSQSTDTLIDIDPVPADGVSTSQFRFFRGTNTTGATRFTVYLGDGTANENHRLAGKGTASYLCSNNGNLGVGTGLPTLAKLQVNGDYAPHVDNTFSSGLSSRRHSVVYAGTGAINTSDAREKTPVRSFTAAELSAAAELGWRIGVYQWLAMVEAKGDSARQHIGLTVQKSIAVLESHGLDPFAYGFICYDEWGELPEVIGEDGEIAQAYRPAGDRYSFRMDELLAFIARGLSHRLSEIERRLDFAGL